MNPFARDVGENSQNYENCDVIIALTAKIGYTTQQQSRA